MNLNPKGIEDVGRLGHAAGSCPGFDTSSGGQDTCHRADETSMVTCTPVSRGMGEPSVCERSRTAPSPKLGHDTTVKATRAYHC